MRKLKNVKKGSLVRFNKRGDVYKVKSIGIFAELENMYTGKISKYKTYTSKGDRTVEVVDFY